MAKHQHKSGTFDPDYRTKGWNKSGFAPKNSTMSISQLSLGIAALVFFAQYLFPQTRNNLLTWDGLLPRAILALVLWLALGLLFRRIMWMRVRGRIEPVTQPPQSDGMFITESQPNIHPETAREFEERVARVLSTLTGYKAVVVGGAGDHGADIKVYSNDRLIGIVQCKKYDTTSALPPGFIRDLYGAKQHFGVPTAYLVTTATFSKDSEKLAEGFGISLMDRDEFARSEIKARKIIMEREKQTNELDSGRSKPTP